MPEVDGAARRAVLDRIGDMEELYRRVHDRDHADRQNRGRNPDATTLA